ncbi:hypothetical protein CUMW_089640 [Citrus unshiu]|nr:hypothetical protein CUMW_089640 [Citrus unshiu]
MSRSSTSIGRDYFATSHLVVDLSKKKGHFGAEDRENLVSESTYLDQLLGENTTLGEALMAPNVIFVKQEVDIISKGEVKRKVNITGSGFTNNISRVLSEGLGVVIYGDSWEIPSIHMESII